MTNNINKKEFDITSGIYIPNIEARWLYKFNKETKNYIVDKQFLKKVLTGKIDFSFELLKNKELLDNITIETFGKNSKGKDKYYTFDIINIMYNEVYTEPSEKDKKKRVTKKDCKQLRDWSYENGVTFEGQRLTNWKRSGGKARVGDNLFLKDTISQNSLDWGRMNLKFTDDVSIAAVRAYESLPLSSIIGSIKIEPKNILIVDDYDSEFDWVMSQTRLEDKELITKTINTKEKNSIFDGEGCLDISVFNKYEFLKGKGAALIRNRMMKCCCFSTNIKLFYQDYCAKHGYDYNTYTVMDIGNRPIKVCDILFITTPNSIKLNKFNEVVLKVAEYKEYGKFAWLTYFLDNCGTSFGVCKTEHPSHFENGKYQHLSYQFVNTLPIKKEELIEVVEKEKIHIRKMQNDFNYFIKTIKQNQDIDTEDILAESEKDEDIEVEYTEDNEDMSIGKHIDVAGAFIQLLQKNSNFKYTKVFKDFRKNYIDAYIRKLRQGKIRVLGDYAICSSCLIELLYSTVGEFDGTSLTLIGNQVYCPKFKDKEKIVGFRNPSVVTGNIGNLVNTHNELIQKYINCTDNTFVITSIGYPVLSIFSGEDMDSDTNLLCNEECIVDACSRLDWNITPIPVMELRLMITAIKNHLQQ